MVKIGPVTRDDREAEASIYRPCLISVFRYLIAEESARCRTESVFVRRSKGKRYRQRDYQTRIALGVIAHFKMAFLLNAHEQSFERKLRYAM